jgi:hypothetical protein
METINFSDLKDQFGPHKRFFFKLKPDDEWKEFDQYTNLTINNTKEIN